MPVGSLGSRSPEEEEEDAARRSAGTRGRPPREAVAPRRRDDDDATGAPSARRARWRTTRAETRPRSAAHAGMHHRGARGVRASRCGAGATRARTESRRSIEVPKVATARGVGAIQYEVTLPHQNTWRSAGPSPRPRPSGRTRAHRARSSRAGSREASRSSRKVPRSRASARRTSTAWTPRTRPSGWCAMKSAARLDHRASRRRPRARVRDRARAAAPHATTVLNPEP